VTAPGFSNLVSKRYDPSAKPFTPTRSQPSPVPPATLLDIPSGWDRANYLRSWNDQKGNTDSIAAAPTGSLLPPSERDRLKIIADQSRQTVCNQLCCENPSHLIASTQHGLPNQSRPDADPSQKDALSIGGSRHRCADRREHLSPLEIARRRTDPSGTPHSPNGTSDAPAKGNDPSSPFVKRAGGDLSRTVPRQKTEDQDRASNQPWNRLPDLRAREPATPIRSWSSSSLASSL
jgi:hypothetical protein